MDVVFHGARQVPTSADSICQKGLDPTLRDSDLSNDYFGNVAMGHSFALAHRDESEYLDSNGNYQQRQHAMVMFLLITNAPGARRHSDDVCTCSEAKYQLPIARIVSTED